jgi:tRNA pseudouridine synthase 10
MRKFPLCELCAARFKPHEAVSKAKAPAGCHICKGALTATQGLVDSALSQASGFEWQSFSVSSTFDKSAFVREEEVAGNFPPGEFTSIKNSINAELVERISKASGKQNDQRSADASFSFNFKEGKSAARAMPLYVFGRYTKLSRDHCQSTWHCSRCYGRGCEACKGSGKFYPSVQDELGVPLMAAYGSKECLFHASGREDVDVRALGSGRPFVLELVSPKKRRADLRTIEKSLSRNPSVRAAGLCIVGKNFMDAVCNSHFEKEYSALVGADRSLTDADAKKVESLTGVILRQQTPKRVLTRRTDMERQRSIIWISAATEGDGKLRLKILAEAGTYIKELVSSDGGRTKPSIAEILSCDASCDELDVVAIRDYFLETIEK